MILPRPRITVGDARFEPGTSAPKVCGALQMSHHTSIFINTLVLTVQYVQYVLYSVHSFFYFFLFFFIFEHAVWRTYVSLFCWWWLCLWARWAWWGQQGRWGGRPGAPSRTSPAPPSLTPPHSPPSTACTVKGGRESMRSREKEEVFSHCLKKRKL